jgi:hypothetical protein
MNEVQSRDVPAVDVNLFERAFNAYQEAAESASLEDREAAGVGAVATLSMGDGVLADHNELFQSVCWRVQMLDDYICTKLNSRVRVLRVPKNWTETAATASIKVLTGFDSRLFESARVN